MNIHIPTKKPANWTDEEKETAVGHFLDGMSTPDIAALMNRTKSSVCGLLDRVRNREIKEKGETRIPARYQMGAVQTFNRQKQKRAKSMNRGNRQQGDTGFRKSTKRQALVIPTITEGMEYDRASHGIPLIDLKATDCRFIVSGSGEDSSFCGQHAAKGSYCEHHHARCHYTPKETIGVYLKRISQVGHSGRTGAFR
jgi:hypothetical protein